MKNVKITIPKNNKKHKIIFISSSIISNCELCNSQVGINDSFGDRINHYIDHGCKIKYIGQETNRTDNDELWQSTVVVLTK
jgi:hypothetical protein